MAKVTSEDYYESKYKLSNRVTGFLRSEGKGFSGCVCTTHGIVNVASQPTYTYAVFVHNGIRYSRTWERAYSKKYCKTLAFEFAEEIVTQN